jgi:hypothetical protein
MKLGLSVETVVRDGDSLLRNFRSFFAFEIVENDVLLPMNTREHYRMYMGEMKCVVVMSK